MSPATPHESGRLLSTLTLARRAEQTQDAVQRNTLLRQLMGRHNANAHLRRLLHAAPAEVKQALLALMETRTARRLADALIAALSDPHASVRQAAAERLAAIRVRKSLEGLMALTRDREPAVCKAALNALAQLGSKRAVGVVEACLENRHAGVRQAAVNALLQLGDWRSAVALVQVLQDKTPVVRLRAVHALVAIKAKPWAKTLVDLIQDSDSFVREAAVRGMGLLASRETLPDLLHIARRGRDGELRREAVEALGHFRDSESAAQLMAALNDGNIEVRCTAAEALARRHERPAAQALAQAAERESDPRAQQHMQACRLALLRADPPGKARPSKRAHPLWRDWYSNPGLDAGSLIYNFRPDGTGDVEDFAMGLTRGRSAFRYRVRKDRIEMVFSGRQIKMETGYRIKRSRYRDPVKGKLACLRLEFAQEPYFTRRGPGRSLYYHVLRKERE